MLVYARREFPNGDSPKAGIRFQELLQRRLSA
jgi:hypothetical protein